MLEYAREALKAKVYMDVAKNISRLSKDENTQIGSVIVAKDGTPVSWGYNGTVSGFRDGVIPHSREKKDITYKEKGEIKTIKADKYPFMCHSEDNAIDFGKGRKLKGATIYITAMPCGDCARKIAKAKLSKVVVLPQEDVEINSSIGKEDDIAKFILTEGNVQLWTGDIPAGISKNYDI